MHRLKQNSSNVPIENRLKSTLVTRDKDPGCQAICSLDLGSISRHNLDMLHSLLSTFIATKERTFLTTAYGLQHNQNLRKRSNLLAYIGITNEMWACAEGILRLPVAPIHFQHSGSEDFNLRVQLFLG